MTPPRKSPRNGQRTSLSPRRSHGKRSAPMQAPDQLAPVRRLGEVAAADKPSSAASSEPDAAQPASSAQPAEALPAAASWGQLAAQQPQQAIGQLNTGMLDQADNLGRAPLHVAAAAGREEIVMQLVQAGCDTSRWLSHDYRCP